MHYLRLVLGNATHTNLGCFYIDVKFTTDTLESHCFHCEEADALCERKVRPPPKLFLRTESPSHPFLASPRDRSI